MSRAIHANRSQRFLLPPSIDEWVAADHPVRFVAELVESIGLEELKFEASPGHEGRPHYAPELLLGVWLYGWMTRVRSTRALEKACQSDIAFVWLTGNLQPDHNTLWRFFDGNKAALKELFKKVVRVAAGTGLVGFTLHALDGTKLQAASSVDSALHKKPLEEQLKKLDAIVEESISQIDADARSALDWKMPESLADKETRKKAILEQLKTLADAQTEHLHPREPDARVMKTRDGRRLGYNAQAVVDHDSDLIVAAEVCSDQNDLQQLAPMVEAAQETLGRAAEHTVADAGYASGVQFEKAERRHLPVLVIMPEEKSTKGEYAKSKFTYDAERRVYICPRGEVLGFTHIEKPSKKTPQPREVFRCRNEQCPVRADCTKDPNGRAVKRPVTDDAVERQLVRQRGSDKRLLMSLRKEIVEHIFGIMKGNDGFRRFTAHGLAGVRAQWALACLAVNLRKLVPAWVGGHLRLTAA